MMVDEQARGVFDSFIKITVGDGSKVLFWKDRWIHGVAVADIAPLLLQSVSTRNRNRRTVQHVLIDNAWTDDVHGELSFLGHMQVYELCQAMATVDRNTEMPDRFEWPCDVSGNYTTALTYKRLCMGHIQSTTAGCIWSS